MIPCGKQDINQGDIDAVAEALQSDFITQGPKIGEFERVVADYTGASHGVAVNIATSATYANCASLKVGSRNLVRPATQLLAASI